MTFECIRNDTLLHIRSLCIDINLISQSICNENVFAAHHNDICCSRPNPFPAFACIFHCIWLSFGAHISSSQSLLQLKTAPRRKRPFYRPDENVALMQLKPSLFDTDSHSHTHRSAATEIRKRKKVLTFLLCSVRKIWMETSRKELVRQPNALHILLLSSFLYQFSQMHMNWQKLNQFDAGRSLIISLRLRSAHIETRHRRGRFPLTIRREENYALASMC